MRAARIDGYGGEEVVKIAHATRPKPASDQVVVEVYAAGVNPFDVKVREGMTRSMAELEFPATLGGDVAGVVAEIGEDVTDFETGQAVYGQAGALSGEGSFAEYVPVKVSQLAPKPESLDFVQSASLPLAAASAYQALVDHMHLQKGQKILIHGAAGGIGSIAVQLAKHLGAYVAATASAEDKDFVKGLGADQIIDYRGQDFAALIKGYDAVFDTVGGETNKKSYAVLRPGGILVSMTGGADEELAKKYKIEYVSQFSRTTREKLEAVAGLVDSGAIKPQVARVFPLDQAAEALEYQKTGKPKGKVVIEVK